MGNNQITVLLCQIASYTRSIYYANWIHPSHWVQIPSKFYPFCICVVFVFFLLIFWSAHSCWLHFTARQRLCSCSSFTSTNFRLQCEWYSCAHVPLVRATGFYFIRNCWRMEETNHRHLTFPCDCDHKIHTWQRKAPIVLDLHIKFYVTTEYGCKSIQKIVVITLLLSI